jgi:hypothetical protein
MPPLGWAGLITQSAELTATDGAAGDRLGASVGMSGSTVVAGALNHAVGLNAKQGAAYLFARPAAGWAGSLTQSGELTAGDGAAEEFFGVSVAVSGDTLVAGAIAHQVGANTGQGAAYVFVTPPSLAIASPINGATYTQGRVVSAAYSCAASAGATLTACSGPVANGAGIDTQALGSHTFTVNARDDDGGAATGSVSYSVVAAITPAPIISGARQTAKTWRENDRRPRISANKKKLPVGTTFSFALNEPATVALSFTQQVTGRRVRGKCLAPSAKNRRKRRCTRTIVAGRFTFAGHPGMNRVRFAGRISRTKKLNAGRYTLQITATNAQGRRSAPTSLTFTIVK